MAFRLPVSDGEGQLCLSNSSTQAEIQECSQHEQPEQAVQRGLPFLGALLLRLTCSLDFGIASLHSRHSHRSTAQDAII